MKPRLLFIQGIALVLAIVGTTLMIHGGAKGVPPPSDSPVTSIIDGNGINTLPTLRIQSDMGGAYQNLSSKHSTSLVSVIQGIGAWCLDMVNFDSSPQRKILIDLRDPVPGSGPNGNNPTAPFAYQLVRARFLANCVVPMPDMLPNNVYPCSVVLGFDYPDGTRYRLVQNPGEPGNYVETNWVQATCVATNTSGKCNQWKLEPSVTQLSGEVKNVAKLLKLASKPNQADQDLGDFYLSFSIQVTNP